MDLNADDLRICRHRGRRECGKAAAAQVCAEQDL